MSGIPGVGKSTLAKKICSLTNAVLLNTDIIKSSVIQSFEDDIDFRLAGKVTYDAVFALACNNLSIGNSVVIDSPCSYEIILERGIHLSKIYNAAYKFIECHVGDLSEVNRRRIHRKTLTSQRYNAPISEIEYQNSINNLKRPADYEYLVINSSPGLDEYIGKVMEYLMK